jgi:hypothetical protein|tara:strand:+ start:223 stop:1101 length:879 start_codon:yes stop_codon:yes gene_type:complete
MSDTQLVQFRCASTLFLAEIVRKDDETALVAGSAENVHSREDGVPYLGSTRELMPRDEVGQCRLYREQFAVAGLVAFASHQSETTPETPVVGSVETPCQPPEIEVADETIDETTEDESNWLSFSNRKDFRENATDSQITAFVSWIDETLIPLFSAHWSLVETHNMHCEEGREKGSDENDTFKDFAAIWQYTFASPEGEGEPCWIWRGRARANEPAAVSLDGLIALVTELEDELESREQSRLQASQPKARNSNREVKELQAQLAAKDEDVEKLSAQVADLSALVKQLLAKATE